MAKRVTLEPLLWLLFSAGGVVAALVIPVLLLLFGLAFPLGLSPPSHEHMLAVLGHPLSRVTILVSCTLLLFHSAHRVRFTLYDGLQIKHLNELIVLLVYGAVLLGTVVAGYLVWQLP
jgi:fumarate reductase subunit D